MRRLVLAAALLCALLACGLTTVAILRHPPAVAERLAVPGAAPAERPTVGAPGVAQPAPRRAPEAASTAPGRDVPVAPAEPAVYDLAWDDGHGRSWRTRITISGASHDLRRHAAVATREAGADADQVLYHGTAFRGRDGRLHIDARDAVVAGPFGSDWSPDSFAIADDLSVTIQDDRHDASRGHVTQVTR